MKIHYDEGLICSLKLCVSELKFKYLSIWKLLNSLSDNYYLCLNYFLYQFFVCLFISSTNFCLLLHLGNKALFFISKNILSFILYYKPWTWYTYFYVELIIRESISMMYYEDFIINNCLEKLRLLNKPL